MKAGHLDSLTAGKRDQAQVDATAVTRGDCLAGMKDEMKAEMWVNQRVDQTAGCSAGRWETAKVVQKVLPSAVWTAWTLADSTAGRWDESTAHHLAGQKAAMWDFPTVVRWECM